MANSLVANSGATTLGGLSAGTFVYGFASGEQKAKFFYYNSAASINLPTLQVPAALPPSNNALVAGVSSGQFVWAQLSSSPIYQLQGNEVAEFGGGNITTGSTSATPGPYLFFLSFTAGSPDAGSPGFFFADPQLVLITSSSGIPTFS